jgi:hypothetical protein
MSRIDDCWNYRAETQKSRPAKLTLLLLLFSVAICDMKVIINSKLLQKYFGLNRVSSKYPSAVQLPWLSSTTENPG